MSDRPTDPVYWSCHRKMRFDKRSQANDASAGIRKTKPGATTHVYHCSECGGFHVAKDRNKRPRVGKHPSERERKAKPPAMRREADAVGLAEWP